MNKRLKDYIKEDVIYQDYKKGIEPESDFDRFCVQHCKDIEDLLNENDKLDNKNSELYKIIQDTFFFIQEECLIRDEEGITALNIDKNKVETIIKMLRKGV